MQRLRPVTDSAAPAPTAHDGADTPVLRTHGNASARLGALSQALRERLAASGYEERDDAADPRLVLNHITPERPTPFRRRAQATFVLSLMELPEVPDGGSLALYPYLVRSLSNMLLVSVPGVAVHFLTPEMGHFVEPEGPDFIERLIQRIEPVASSVLVIDNVFVPDLEPELRQGDEHTRALSEAGRRLAEWDLLPAPFPLEDVLSERDRRHVKRLYGIGGLSYGNLSARKDAERFWMSASGVDKARLETVGRDILLVTGYDAERNAMYLSVPKGIEPRRVSVDAIEHWLIYREHPSVGAIIHVHAWLDGVPSTQFTYPCGTYQLGEAVAEKIRQAEEPARAVVGLKNHGLTITGVDLNDIFERIGGKLRPTVPMT
jgi:ribulose-5-phosphate 4-epimerase/fuculose-1-phosphate aldolase